MKVYFGQLILKHRVEMFRQILLLIAISSIHAMSDCIGVASNILKGGHNVTIDSGNKFENLYLQLKDQYEDELKKLQIKYDFLEEKLMAYGENVLSSCSDQKLNTNNNLEVKVEEIYSYISVSKAQTNSLMDKVDKLYETLTKTSAPQQNTTIIQSPSNQHFDEIVTKRTKRIRGKHVGCFQDNGEYRLMRGYVTRMKLNHVEMCVTLCRFGNFVYAGLS